VNAALAVNERLLSAARLSAWAAPGRRISLREIVLLALCGAGAALLVALVPWNLRIPGHAILRVALPMALGLALVPRRASGSIMAAAGGAVAATLAAAGLGHAQPAAIAGLVAIGPALDLATSAGWSGWRLYAGFVMAGAMANLLAFGVRFSTAWLAIDPARSRAGSMNWGWALVSFILCGAVAGLIGAALCFRASTDVGASDRQA
jgi:hypothetical protein